LQKIYVKAKRNYEKFSIFMRKNFSTFTLLFYFQKKKKSRKKSFSEKLNYGKPRDVGKFYFLC
jgi:hypothetical protein